MLTPEKTLLRRNASLYTLNIEEISIMNILYNVTHKSYEFKKENKKKEKSCLSRIKVTL